MSTSFHLIIKLIGFVVTTCGHPFLTTDPLDDIKMFPPNKLQTAQLQGIFSRVLPKGEHVTSPVYG